MVNPLAFCPRLVAGALLETVETRHENCIALVKPVPEADETAFCRIV
jgi:hypothetical protein